MSNEKVFTKDEMEAIIEKRLSRERKNEKNMKKIREFLSYIRKNEEFKDLSNAELAERLALVLTKTAEIPEDKGTPDAPPSEKKTETEMTVSEPKDRPKDTEAAISEEDSDEGKRRLEIFEFIEKYGKNELENLIRDRAFPEFCRGKTGNLVSLFEDYRAFLAALTESDTDKKQKQAEAGLASTGFSGYSSGGVDYSEMLTDNQKRIASAAGMSAKQYYELLSQIPTKNIKKK